MVKLISFMLLILTILIVTMITITIVIANCLRFYAASSSFYRYLQSELLSESTYFWIRKTWSREGK